MAAPGCLDRLTCRFPSKARASARGSPAGRGSGTVRNALIAARRDPACRGTAAQARWCGTGCGCYPPQDKRRSRARPAGGPPRGGWRCREPRRGGVPLTAALCHARPCPWCRASGRAWFRCGQAAEGPPGPARGCPAPEAQCPPARPALSIPLCAYRHHQPLPPFAGRPPPGPWPLLSGRVVLSLVNPLPRPAAGTDTRLCDRRRLPAILAAAQDGSEDAFAALWREANPALLRYLRVAAPEAAEDVAAEVWVQVVRGLANFRGDERDCAGGCS